MTGPAPSGSGLAEIIGSFFGGAGAGDRPAVPAADAPVPAPLTAESFRGLVASSEQAQLDKTHAAEHAADLARTQQVKTMLHDHLGDGVWDSLMEHARAAAAHGGKEIELLRFPSELCSDSGRKINNLDPAWAETLRGEAAELEARWARELKHAGFGLAARVMDYPKGMPGNVALVLTWDQP